MSGFRRYFVTGLLAIAPVVVTVWVLWRLYRLVDGGLRPWLERVPGLNTQAIPDFALTLAGVLAFLLLIALVGVFTRNLLGVAFFSLVERTARRIPLIKGIFTATKQISEVFLQDHRTAFQKVVLFEYPRPGVYSVGFVTFDNPDLALVGIFLPTTPNPTSGYLLLIPRQQVVRLPLTVEEGIRLIISGGAVMTLDQGRAIQRELLASPLTRPELPAADPAGDPRGLR